MGRSIHSATAIKQLETVYCEPPALARTIDYFEPLCVSNRLVAICGIQGEAVSQSALSRS